MSESEAWRIVYDGKSYRRNLKATTICFTGFVEADKANYRALATDVGLRVTEKVSGTTNYLCTGPNAGPSKVTKAKEAGAVILTLDDFLHIMDTGELP